MELILGAAFQGKLDYALKKNGYTLSQTALCETCDIDDIYNNPVIYKFNFLIKRLIESDIDPYTIVDSIIKKNPNAIIITDEIGYGLVPMDKNDRLYRETTGRVCSYIAQKSDKVERIICSIPITIKENRNEKNLFDTPLNNPGQP